MHVAITGASSGIGHALAKRFAEKGYAVTIIARRKNKLEELAKSLETRVSVQQADLSDLKQATAWVEAAEKALGPIDVIINNAGMQYVAAAETISDEEAEKLLRLNVSAPMRIINRVLPTMQERGTGTIVNIASLSAIAKLPGMAHYSASKAALANYSETLRIELKQSKVKVLTVYPGPVETPMAEASLENLDSGLANLTPMGTPDKLAHLIFNSLGKKRLIYPSMYALQFTFPNISQFFIEKFAPMPG